LGEWKEKGSFFSATQRGKGREGEPQGKKKPSWRGKVYLRKEKRTREVLARVKKKKKQQSKKIVEKKGFREKGRGKRNKKAPTVGR